MVNMARLYGNPTKLVQIVDDRTFTIGPQRFQIIPFWYTDDSQDPAEGATVTNLGLPLGARVVSHHVKQTMTPETIEPQEVSLAIVKLSFHDHLAEPILGKTIAKTSAGAVSASDHTNALKAYTNTGNAQVLFPTGDQTLDIDTMKGDDFMPHFLKWKDAWIMDQRPFMGRRYMKVPAKVKRANRFTYYGMLIYNDSTRGTTPADTNIVYRIKQHIKYYAL